LTAGERPSRFDAVVVGGGIMGCATAYHLARRGLSVQVVERGSVASEQSSRAWGFVRQQGRHAAEVPLAREASRLWDGLARELGADVEFVRGGILVLADTEADEARMVAAQRVARENGVGSRLLTPAEIAQRMPGLAGAWRAGLLTDDDGHVEPVKATLAYANAARRLGVRIAEHTPVIGIAVAGGKATGAVTAQGVIAGDAIVCAAGIGTADLVRGVGTSLPIQAVRGTVARTRTTAYTGRTAVWAPHVAFRPLRDGSFVVGNGYHGVDAECDLTPDALRHLRLFVPTFIAHREILKLRIGEELVEGVRRRLVRHGMFAPWPEPQPTRRLVDYTERQLYRVLPGLGNPGIARAWAGRIDATPDLIPIIGRVAGVDRLTIAAGFNGHGLALAPVVGRLLAEWVVDGRPSLDLSRFRAERFADGMFERARGAL
jgi:glycine/D-amino acid oxidase-like deaminating enzyme